MKYFGAQSITFTTSESILATPLHKSEKEELHESKHVKDLMNKTSRDHVSKSNMWEQY